MSIHTYNPKEVHMTIGSHIVTGFAEDSFISIEPSGDGITKKVGCHGDIARSITPDYTCKVKISTLQHSDINAFLRASFKHDRDTGDGIFPLLIKDLTGGVMFSSESAWIAKEGTITYGKESGNLDWEIDTAEYTIEDE